MQSNCKFQQLTKGGRWRIGKRKLPFVNNCNGTNGGGSFREEQKSSKYQREYILALANIKKKKEEKKGKEMLYLSDSKESFMADP